MSNTLSRIDVDHNKFTIAISVYSQNMRFLKVLNFIIERPRTRLGLIYIKYLGPKFWSSLPKAFKNLQKDNFKYSFRNFD